MQNLTISRPYFKGAAKDEYGRMTIAQPYGLRVGDRIPLDTTIFAHSDMHGQNFACLTFKGYKLLGGTMSGEVHIADHSHLGDNGKCATVLENIMRMDEQFNELHPSFLIENKMLYVLAVDGNDVIVGYQYDGRRLEMATITFGE
jgi:hypothetical protein